MVALIQVSSSFDWSSLMIHHPFLYILFMVFRLSLTKIESISQVISVFDA